MERPRHCRRDDPSDASSDRMNNDACYFSSSPSSVCPDTNCAGAAPDIGDGGAPCDFVFSAGGRARIRCIRRQDVLSLAAAAALLLCYQTGIVCVGASSSSSSPPPRYFGALRGGGGGCGSSSHPHHPPLLFVSTVRDSLISTILARQQSSLTKPSMSVQRKTPQRSRKTFNVDTTWSNAVRQRSDLNESRFGVRKRVRTVLDKAKKRTGIENGSESNGTENEQQLSSSRGAANGESSSFVQTGLNIMADAASVGGIGDEAVFDGEEGSVDVALEYISRGMGDIAPVKRYDDARASLTTIALSSYEERYENIAILTTKVAEDVNGTPASNGVKLPNNNTPPSSTTVSAATSTTTPEDDSAPQRKVDVQIIDAVREEKAIVATNAAASGDVASAPPPVPPAEPLPFVLPKLTPEQSRRVRDGERVQYQDDMGLAGSGFVVWDVKAPASVVWDCLLDFKSYPQTIPTVREVVMYTNTHLKEDYRAERPLDFEDGTAAICKHGVPSVTRAQFLLSKFKLKVAAVHKYRVHPRGDYMIFTLDPASTNVVLKYAKGIWYTQSNPDGKEGCTRVWLLCELRVSRLLPKWIVDYAAARAMPRATTWLKPQTEAAAMLWLKDTAERRE